MVHNKSFIFKKVPTSVPVPGEHLVVEDRGFDDSAPPPPGGITTENLYASFDPYQRGKMRDPSVWSYSPPYPLDSVIPNGSIVRVLKSDNPRFKPGDVLTGGAPIQEHSVFPKEALDSNSGASLRVLDNPYNLDLKIFVGALGMPGLTAYSSFYAIGKPKKGETIFITGASGAVGAIVGQLAKHEGLRVVGSVGSDEKLRYLKETLGFDDGFNYKTCGDIMETVKRVIGDQGIDIYYDNVGGEQLEAAIDCCNVRARIVACGSISQYNTPLEERRGIHNTHSIVIKRITWRGFIVSDPDMGPPYAEEHQRNMQQWIAEGKFKVDMDVTRGIDRAPEGFVGMLQGRNFGKAVLDIKGSGDA